MADTLVCIESGSRRVFASALEWPGWCRSARTEDEALEVLAGYASRYAPVTARAGVGLPSRAAEGFEVVERLVGNTTTDFGAPAIAAGTNAAITLIANWRASRDVGNPISTFQNLRQ